MNSEQQMLFVTLTIDNEGEYYEECLKLANIFLYLYT